jgi:TRAP-type C4-dicarboxylate transport system permease small subunit
MTLCGLSIGGFTLSVLCDVVTREIGRPWLWLQLVTTGFFAWGVFIGMAVATRRLDHLNLVEITKAMSGPRRTFMEIFNRLVILAVGAAMVVFGYQNFLLDFGSVRAPSLIPLSTYTASVPIAGVLICLFSLEQIANGWRHGFEGPEDKDDFAGIK